MKYRRWEIVLGVTLVACALAVYGAQVAIFHETRNTFFYLFQDLAFVPVQVLLVTLILNAALVRREREELLKKMNMVIGAFFSQTGTPLVRELSSFDRDTERIRPWVLFRADWSPRQFDEARAQLRAHTYAIATDAGDLAAFKASLIPHRDFLLGLLENPNLLEHESFTELLWAVSHLCDELSYRNDVTSLSTPDATHLAGDIQRAYALLLSEWLAYCKHLKADYPYIFSLVVRTNPFDPNAKVEVG